MLISIRMMPDHIRLWELHSVIEDRLSDAFHSSNELVEIREYEMVMEILHIYYRRDNE